VRILAITRNFAILTVIGPVGLSVLASSGAQASASGNTVTRSSCARAHSLTLASDSSARIYGTGTDAAFACLKSTNRSIQLKGASASQDVFALTGAWVGWTSQQRTTVAVMNIRTRTIPSPFPFGVGDVVVRIVVKSDGAAAWAADVSDGTSYVQGMDRRNHSPDQFSDDAKFVRGVSLRSGPGRQIGWQYTDGSTGTAHLF
jgi:hypothetical protein